MGLILVNQNGVVIAQVDKDTLVTFESREQGEQPLPPPASPPPAEGGKRLREVHPRKIVLGPKSRPPLPMSIQVMKAINRPRRGLLHYPLVIRLDHDVEGDHLSPDVSERLAQALSRVGSAGAFEVDVYIPPRCSIDMTQLSRHIADSANFEGRPLAIRVGSEFSED